MNSKKEEVPTRYWLELNKYDDIAVFIIFMDDCLCSWYDNSSEQNTVQTINFDHALKIFDRNLQSIVVTKRIRFAHVFDTLLKKIGLCPATGRYEGYDYYY